jgi:hypothetical protein
MKHRFQKGQPRPETAGRRAGTPNRNTQEVGRFCREVLETREFQQEWYRYFIQTPLDQIEPKLLALAFAYAYGRPRERVEAIGTEDGSMATRVIFYLPSNQRDAQITQSQIGGPHVSEDGGL